jgi:hypothetical protein
MGNWYKVTKRINGRLYDYWQRTFSVGKSVKTENRYIGPVSHAAPIVSAVTDQYERTVAEHREYLGKAAFVAPPQPDEPIFTPVTLSAAERREDERIQYGSRAARIRKQKAAVRKVKRKTKGIKSANPFLAQALIKKP